MLFCRNKRRSSSVKLETIDENRRSGIISDSVDTLDDTLQHLDTYPKSRGEEDVIRKALQENEFLSIILSEERLQKFIECMQSQEVVEGQILIREGETGSHLYISSTGRFQVTVKDKIVLSFDDVRVFGELAILFSVKRHATVKALENGSLWVLDCRTFKRLIIQYAIKEQQEMMSFLSNVSLLNKASPENLHQVANLLQSEFYSTSTEIVKQGELGDKFFIIRAGSVTVQKDDEIVAKLSKGQYFGELALLNDEFRQATVTADSPGTECLTLTRKEFFDHFGDIDEFMKIKTGRSAKTNTTEFCNIHLQDLQLLKTIGIGAYGRVKLVQHKSRKNLVFAMKYSRKVDICKKSHQKQVYNEKHLHMSCQSVFITRMYKTFRDSKYLYFLMEAGLGGDLWSLLHKQKSKRFDEDSARFYSGCVLEGLSYLHDRGIIYRDLKPENIIVHHNGYLKLADFGFAKELDAMGKTYTFVGTAEYIAPEILLNKGYDKGVDYWAFGVFVYELLVGKTPFRSHDPDHLQTYRMILRGLGGVVIPYFLGSKAKNLVKKLCSQNANDRLGCLKGGVTSIKEHPWYSSLNWDKLVNLELEPPFKPQLQNNIDTRYFDKFPEEKDIPQDDFSEWDNDF